MRKPVIAVIGGADVSAEVINAAEHLGVLIARQGWILLNGGRNAGVMAASARGARRAGGFVVGVLPDNDRSAAAPELDLAIVTGMGYARNVINVLSADVVVALPGSVGTISEIAHALNHHKRVVLLGTSVGPGFESFLEAGLVTSCATPPEAVAQARQVIAEQQGTGHPSP